MTTNLSEAEILKTDVLGRVKVDKARREAILDEFEKSGMAGVPFAKMIGVNYQTFASWIQKRRKARGQYGLVGRRSKAPAVKLLEAVVPPSASEQGTLTIELPGGARVKVSRPEELELLCRFLATLGKMEMRGC